MSRHEITSDEIDEWLSDQWRMFARSFGVDSNKQFEVNPVRGLYRVTDHEMAIYEGAERAEAIRAYNEAP